MEKKVLKMAAVLCISIGIIIMVGTYLFMKDVKNQLWEKSIGYVMEVTAQGEHALDIQFQKDYEALDVLLNYLRVRDVENESDVTENLDKIAANREEEYIYVVENSENDKIDETVNTSLQHVMGKGNTARGVIAPHINSLTGENVFDIYVKGINKKGQEVFLVKTYGINEVAEKFSISFYGNTGFSYITDRQGNVLIRSSHPNSNKTFHNLIDMIQTDQNNSDEVLKFQNALRSGETGWATFLYDNIEMVFCFVPLKDDVDWYLVSIIPKAVMDKQTQDIILKVLLLLGLVITGIGVLLFGYMYHMTKSQKKIETQAAFVTHLYHSIPEGICFLTVEEPYLVLQMNKEGLRIFGFPYEENFQIIQNLNMYAFVYDEDQDYILKIFEKVLNFGMRENYVCRMKRTDSTVFWAGGIIERSLDMDGKEILIATFNDITKEKMEEEERIKEQTLERRSLIRAISIAYPLILSGNLSKDFYTVLYKADFINPLITETGGYDDLIQKTSHWIHPDFQQKFCEVFSKENLRKQYKSGKNNCFMEVQVLHQDEIYHWISVQTIYVENPFSDEQIMILLMRVIDEQKHREEQRRQVLKEALDNANAASQAKSQFLSGMSHDIRTPMNAITGMTLIAKTNVENPEKVKQCLSKIEVSSQHLLGLINEILDMAKIESGKMVLNEEAFLLSEFIDDILKIVQPQLSAKSQQFEVVVSDIIHEHLVADCLRLNRVFLNILSNAIKFTPNGGTITFKIMELPQVHRGYAQFQFEFKDTGMGMPQEFLEKIFDPFTRAKDSIADKIEGTGLGMAITKSIVELMAGKIEVKSQVGIGSTFIVTIPLKIQEENDVDFKMQLQNFNVLVIDDDISICENVVQALRRADVNANWATSGPEGIKFIQKAIKEKKPYNVILLDWKMPEMNGLETSKVIRKMVGREIPIIVLTAHDWEIVEDEARKFGIDAFLAKPFFMSRFCAVLKVLYTENKDTVEMKNEFSCAGYKFLLVEDNSLNCEIILEILSMFGAKDVDVAVNGQEAIDVFQNSSENEYDLIFMDVQMPVLNGYEAVKKIRALDRADAKKVPIIAMTADAFADDVEKAILAGMNQHIAKPIDVEMLVKAIKKILVH